MFRKIYKGKKVFVTGVTGFKGSWLAYWLQRLGARVTGYALLPPTSPSHYDLLGLDVEFIQGDIRDADKLEQAVKDSSAEIVFHLAAQPLVRLSYNEPIETFSTNVMGTLNLFEACRKSYSVRAIVNVTSDKCYDNREWVWGYRENDPMGGYDPYSASKGCAELVTSSYRNSYFNNSTYSKEHNTLLASCRAGNVIGGGDWAEDRLVPDIMRAVSQGERVSIRNPHATRPWQHVLEPLGGYLMVGKTLLEGKVEYADGWNFGPADSASVSVRELVTHVKKYWNRIDYSLAENQYNLHEAKLLKLDCSKAHAKLKWQPVWDVAETFKRTVDWYRCFYEDGIILTDKDIEEYENSMDFGNKI